MMQGLVTVQGAKTGHHDFVIMHTLITDVVHLRIAEAHNAVVPLSPGHDAINMRQGSSVELGQLNLVLKQIATGDDELALCPVHLFLSCGKGMVIEGEHELIDAGHDSDLIALDVPSNHARVLVRLVEDVVLLGASDLHLGGDAFLSTVA